MSPLPSSPGFILNVDGSQSDPLTQDVVIPRPPPGLEPTIVLPNPHALVVTVDPHSGNLVAPDGGCFVDAENRRVVNIYGEVVRRLRNSTRITIVTTNGTLVDVRAKHDQLNPETLELVAETTAAVQPIYTPELLQPIPFAGLTNTSAMAHHVNAAALPQLILIVAYNAELDLYLDVATNRVVYSDGSERDLATGRIRLEPNPYTIIIPANPRSIVCTTDDAGNLVTSDGDYIDLERDQIIYRDGTNYTVPDGKVVVRATDEGTVVDARHPVAQMDPESLIPLRDRDMSNVHYTRTPESLNHIETDDDAEGTGAGAGAAASSDDPLSQTLAAHGISRLRDERLVAHMEAAAAVRAQQTALITGKLQAAVSNLISVVADAADADDDEEARRRQSQEAATPATDAEGFHSGTHRAPDSTEQIDRLHKARVQMARARAMAIRANYVPTQTTTPTTTRLMEDSELALLMARANHDDDADEPSGESVLFYFSWVLPCLLILGLSFVIGGVYKHPRIRQAASDVRTRLHRATTGYAPVR